MSKTNIASLRLEDYKEEYLGTNCVFLPNFLNEQVLKNFLSKLDEDAFESRMEYDKDHGKFGSVLVPTADNISTFMLNMVMNDKELFKQIELITGCETIGNFSGRIHRSEGGEEHEIDWHGDNSDHRLVAITICLGNDDYTGAKFQIRKKETETVLREFGQVAAGDAFIFKIHPELEHCLSPVKTGRRTVGVGWFRSRPDFETYTSQYFKAR